jgi:hypothetical protein
MVSPHLGFESAEMRTEIHSFGIDAAKRMKTDNKNSVLLGTLQERPAK